MTRAVLLACFWAGALLLWLIPVLKPRGYYFGHYGPVDLALAGLATVIVIAATGILLAPRHARTELGFRLSAVTISTSATLLLLDVVYTLFFLGAWNPNYWLDRAHITRAHNVADEELGFVRKPNILWDSNLSYRTDENGFRNPPGITTADVVFVGDSFTEAAEVAEEDTFVGRVGLTTRLRVVNLGRGAYGPQQELVVLRRYGLRYRPRYVVWQLFDGNDLSDAEEYTRWRDNPRSPDVPLLRRYFSNSLIRHWAKTFLNLPERPGPTVRIRRPGGSIQVAPVRYAYRPDLPSELARGADETMRAIAAGSRLCRERGIHLIILFIPTMLQVYEDRISFDRPEDQQRYLPAASGGDADFGTKVQQWCEKSGCSYLNVEAHLRDAFRRKDRAMYVPGDEHLTPAGHEVVATVIVEALSRSSAEVASAP